jgi:hypothetical protein
LIGGAAAGAIGLGLGRWVPAAAALDPLRPASTYVALRDAISPLDTAGRVTATTEFERWWVGQDEDMRRHVHTVFDALDRGDRGSFAQAARGTRAKLLADWTQPSADPLRDAGARERLSLGRGAVALAHAPQNVPDGRVPLA